MFIEERRVRISQGLLEDDSYLLIGISTPLSGNFYNSSANNQNEWGNWWSSTYNNGNNMYKLNVNPTNVNPNNNNNRNNGNSMRCLVGE